MNKPHNTGRPESRVGKALTAAAGAVLAGLVRAVIDVVLNHTKGC